VDPKKAASNLRKHGVDLADAVIALEGKLALTLDDDYPDEQRFIMIGSDASGQILVVIYTFRGRKHTDYSGSRGDAARAQAIYRRDMKKEYDFSTGVAEPVFC
jgi:uncharacterized DUF497 family protein